MIVGILMALLANVAVAQTPPSPIVTAKLLVDAPLVKRGKPIAAAVQFTIPEHWHIYWANPGDSGLTTSLSWTLPEGLSAGNIEWPAPERLSQQGITNYGYSDAVTLPVALMPTRDDVVGEVRVKASWLACKDICVPESAELHAMLNGDAGAANAIATARAQVPQAFTGTATFDIAKDAVTLTITRDNPWGDVAEVTFFPLEDGIMANDPAGTSKTVGNELSFTLPRGASEPIATWHGVLALKQDSKRLAWNVMAQNNGKVAPSSTAGSTSSPAGKATRLSGSSEGALNAAPIAPNFLLALALAFLGGLVLNIMPCVLPILALKALALAKKSQASRRVALRQGISYTTGVVVSFLLIAGAMLALKAGGAAIGWGFQLQNPIFVGFLALVMLAVSANLLGLFELPVLFGERATAIDDSSLRGSFFTGVLAVLVATPCTAPFMATAIGATLSMPTLQALSVFAALGLGMAFPFLLISLWPAARRLLPKPGAWMHRFKQILAVPMLATAAWLLFVLSQLLMPAYHAGAAGYEMYSANRLQQLRETQQPLLLDATAAWCLTCKVNEHAALKTADMQQFLKDHHVVIMIADWTSSDPEITKLLASFGRNGVPLYVYYPPMGEPKVLPQILTPAIVRDTINGISL